MFKKGDIIVCIDNEDDIKSITEGKRYTVQSNAIRLWIRNDNNAIHCYSASRFITTQEDRRLKLDKLCSKKGIK